MSEKPRYFQSKNIQGVGNTSLRPLFIIGGLSIITASLFHYFSLGDSRQMIAEREKYRIESEENTVKEMIRKYDFDGDGKLGEDELLMARREAYK